MTPKIYLTYKIFFHAVDFKLDCNKNGKLKKWVNRKSGKFKPSGLCDSESNMIACLLLYTAL